VAREALSLYLFDGKGRKKNVDADASFHAFAAL